MFRAKYITIKHNDNKTFIAHVRNSNKKPFLVPDLLKIRRFLQTLFQEQLK